MAFEYSDYFRKHKRVVFAALTLVALVSFVLGDALSSRQGGGAGVGQRSRGWFGATGEPVAVVDGEKFDEQRMEEVGLHRYLLLNYLFDVYREGQAQSYLALGFTPQEAAFLPQLLQEEQQLQQRGQSLATRPDVPQDIKELLKKYEEVRKSERYAAVFKPKKDALTVGLLQTMPTDSLAPFRLVEFLYWKNRAEEMGVVMPNGVVMEDLLNLAVNKLTETDLQTLRARMQKNRQLQQPLTMDDMLKLIGDELKAMIARDLAQGGQQMSFFSRTEAMNKLAQTTPLDLWNGYEALKTKLDVAIVPLSVMNKEFIEKVKAPTAEDLKAYFAKYKDKLPSKDSDTPGFKLPRSYKVDLIHANLRVTQPARKFYEKVAESLDAINPVGAFTAIVADYQKRRNEFRLSEINEDFPVGAGADRKFVRLGSWGALREDPQLAAQVAGALAGASAAAPQGLFGGAYVLQPGFRAVPAKETQALEAAEAIARIAGGAFDWGALAAAPPKTRRLFKERFRPLEEVANILSYDRMEERSRELLQADLKKLGDDLLAYGKKHGEAKAKWRATRRPGGPAFVPPPFDAEKKLSIEDHIRQFAAARGLTYAGMKNGRPVEELFDEKGDDNALTTYILPIFSKFVIQIPEEQLKRFIAQRLAAPEKRLYEWEERRPMDPKWFELAFTWKADQTEERVPTFEEAEPAVRIAWMKEQARPFVQQAAEALAAEVKKQPDGIKLLMDKPGFKGHETVARYSLAANQAAAAAPAYEATPVPVIENPPADFVDDALKTLKAPGDSMVVWNKPRTSAYLVTLRERTEPKPDEAATRERFDFDIILPGLGRQPTVDGRPFSEFVQAEKVRRMRGEWQRFLKSHTQYNEALADKTAEQLRGLTRG